MLMLYPNPCNNQVMLQRDCTVHVTPPSHSLDDIIIKCFALKMHAARMLVTFMITIQ